MIKSISCFFALLVHLSSIFGQVQTLYSEGRAKDKTFYKSQAIIPVFLLQNDTIEENVAFGVEDKLKNKKRTIILPLGIAGQRNTGYGYLYSGAANQSFAKGYLLFLITNNSRNNLPALIFFDKNIDFDLSNDGPPDTMHFYTDYLDIHLHNPNYGNAKHIIKISRFDYKNQQKYINLTDIHYKKHSGSKNYMGTYYSFREQRLNVLAYNFKNQNDSFTIAIKDNNCNGLFNDENDEIFISNYRTEHFTETSFMIDKNNVAHIETNGKMFKIDGITYNGSSININQVTDKQFIYQLNVGKKIPKTRFQLADTGKIKTKKIRKFRRKPSYIYFSNSRTDNIEEDTAYLRKIHTEFGKKINVIFINSGDIPREAKKMAILGRLPYTCGISDQNIDNLWFINRKPIGFLTKKRLKLQQVGITPIKLYNQLKNGE